MDKESDNHQDKLPLMMQNFSVLLRAIRARDKKSQDEMGQALAISRVNYGQYENNKTANREGIPLSLLLKVADLEEITLYRLIDILSGESLHQKVRGRSIERWKQKILDNLLGAPRKYRDQFINFLDELYSDHDPAYNEYMGDRTTWVLRTFSLLSRQPLRFIMEIERSVLEKAFENSTDPAEKQDLLQRMEEISKWHLSYCKRSARDDD